MKFFRWIELNIWYILKLACQWTAYFLTLLGFLETFVHFGRCFEENSSLFYRVLDGCSVLILSFLFVFALCLWYFYRHSQVKILDVSNGYHVFVQYGDIFSPNEVLHPKERRNIVIPVNRCFDTIVDDDLISSNTLHGVAMKKIYQQKIYSQESLNMTIQKYLSDLKIETEQIKADDKRKGNLERFPVGTVAEVKGSDQCTYFFMALSTFDKDLHAHTSDEEYVLSLVRLLKFCNKRSQKYPVVIPLIGAGGSETGKTERDILEYLVKLIKLHKSLISYDLHIIVRDNGKVSIPILGL